MAIAEDSAVADPTPEHLAERLLDLGDPDVALDVLERALRRDPGSDRARALRSRALLYKRNAHALTPRPSVVDDFTEELAETYIQRGFLEEAQIVYQRVLRHHRHDPLVGRRAELLFRVLRFRVDPSADSRLRRAEELIAVGRLASALAEYRILARDLPDDATIVQRANDLRLLVLGRQPRDPAASLDQTTAVGASPRAAAGMLEEGKLEEAMMELGRLAATRSGEPVYAEAVAALTRLVDAPAFESSEASPIQSTRPMRQVNFVEMHIRLGNLAAAAELFRGMVEKSPGDEVARQRLADLRTLLRFIRTVDEHRSSTDPPPTRSGVHERAPDPPDVPLRKAMRSGELKGYRPITDPLKKSPSLGFRADEDVTAVVRPEEQAELYIRQGFFEKAAEIYRMLVVRHPQHLRFQERLVYLERRIVEQHAPAPAPSVMELVDVPRVEPPRPDAGVSGEDLVFRAPSTDRSAAAGDLAGYETDKTPVSEPAFSPPPVEPGDSPESARLAPLIDPAIGFEDQPTGQDHLADRPRIAAAASPALETAPTTLFPVVPRVAISNAALANTIRVDPGVDPFLAAQPPPPPPAIEPANSELATMMMPQMTLPITPVKPGEGDGSVSVRRIILVGSPPKRRR
ncbi:MAG: tetratricopeptide repeat protein [Deltaproteobacteria bacterium]|nr:tetratricopeptide repeat protein [Deltaproteobacteria bacterium]